MRLPARKPVVGPSSPDAFHGPGRIRALAMFSVTRSGSSSRSILVSRSALVLLLACGWKEFVGQRSPLLVLAHASRGSSVAVRLRSLPQDASIHRILLSPVADVAVSVQTQVPSSCDVLCCARRASLNPFETHVQCLRSAFPEPLWNEPSCSSRTP